MLMSGWGVLNARRQITVRQPGSNIKHLFRTVYGVNTPLRQPVSAPGTPPILAFARLG